MIDHELSELLEVMAAALLRTQSMCGQIALGNRVSRDVAFANGQFCESALRKLAAYGEKHAS